MEFFINQKDAGIYRGLSSSITMAPKCTTYGMSINLPRHGPKWKSANYKINKSVSSNEVGANVKKTNTDFGISILNMKYVIRNMHVLIPCQEPSFWDITITF